MGDNRQQLHIVARKFHEMTEEHHMLGCSSVVLALSGGADSRVLLELLYRECKKRGIILYALHVHHGIRGSEADRDANFCIEICKKLGVPLEIVQFDIPALAKAEGKGLEECARDHRYRALDDFCRRMSIDRIATAHNADDNLETLLFHLTRGAATGSALGIAPIRANIIRPLLTCTKTEIIDYAEQNGFDFVSDSTNLDSAYSRNFLRNEVVPMLRSLNPRVAEAATRFCRYQREDTDLLDKLAAESVSDDCSVLSRLPLPILRRVLEQSYRNASGIMSMPSSQLDALCELVKKARNKSMLSLSKICARIEDGRLVFTRDMPKSRCDAYRYPLALGENLIPEADGIICVYENIGEKEEKEIKEKQNIYKLFIQISFTFDTIEVDDLFVRSKADGDRIRYGNMTRSLKKLFCEKKIASERRERYPVVCHGNEIIWVPGFPVADSVSGKVGTDPCRMLHVFYFEGSKA